jgi:hypothetical protein
MPASGRDRKLREDRAAGTLLRSASNTAAIAAAYQRDFDLVQTLLDRGYS